MAARSKARKRALDVLYESDVRDVDALGTLAERVALADPPVNDYTIELVEGVQANRDRIDEILAEYAEGWTVARMPDVDRAVLRLGVYELLWRDDVPPTPSRSTRRSSWPSRCRPTSRRASSTACWPGCCATGPRLGHQSRRG